MAYDTHKIFSPQLYIHGASHFVSVGVPLSHGNLIWRMIELATHKAHSADSRKKKRRWSMFKQKQNVLSSVSQRQCGSIITEECY